MPSKRVKSDNDEAAAGDLKSFELNAV